MCEDDKPADPRDEKLFEHYFSLYILQLPVESMGHPHLALELGRAALGVHRTLFPLPPLPDDDRTEDPAAPQEPEAEDQP